MITCPNCGAGNKPGSSTCRMCATSLEGIVEAQAARGQSHAPGPESHKQEEARPPVEQEGIICPDCSTMNEPGWSFCQQCGKRLTKPASPPPQKPAAPEMPADLRTIPEQQAVVDPMVGLKTNPDPQPAERSYKTVVAQPPPFERPQKSEHDDQPTEPVTPRQPLPAAPPTVVAQPPFARPSASKPDIPPMQSAPVEPVPPKPTAPTPPPPVQQQPAAPTPPPGPTREPMEQVGPMSGALCMQCGQSNTVGSAFCASCGAPMTFGKTMVISSQTAPPAPPKGRLHLVMEGGQAGEVYELSDDTVIGRTNGEITFPHDGFMSGRHARVELRGSTFILTDEGSRNGTFIKLKEEVELQPGDMILVGKQLFRFEVEK